MNAQANLIRPESGRRRAHLSLHPAHSAVNWSSTPDRVVTLAALSHNIADRFIAQTLSRALQVETGCSVLLVHLELAQGRISLQDWADLHPRLNGEFGLKAQLEPTEQKVGNLNIRVSGDPAEIASIALLVNHARSHFQYVLLHVGADVPMSLLMECLVQSDRTFLFLQPTAENLYHRDLLLREVRSQPRGDSLNLKAIVCREKDEEHFNELLKQMGNSVHGFIHGCPTPAMGKGLHHWHDKNFNADIRRLTREVAHRRIGLALSSGGARGLAHIGVIQVLEENGIEVDVIAGCSMGAYIGSVWAFGYDGVVMERLSREVEHRWGLLELIDPFILPRQGFLRGEKVKRRLKKSIGDVHFSELVRPLRVVATALSTLERTVFSSGEVAAAVHASSAIPGACVPVKLDGELYIDGGIADPLPVDVLQEMGIERIIAVNTIPTPAYLRCRLEMEREQAVLHNQRPGKLKSILNHYLNYFAPGNILDTILRSFSGAQMRVADLACLDADVVLRPLSFDGRWHDFRHPGKYIALGRREAEEHLDEIKALVNRKDPIHERNLAHESMATAT
jgi:NTE family protein